MRPSRVIALPLLFVFVASATAADPPGVVIDTTGNSDIAAAAEIEQATSERKRAEAERRRAKAAEAEARAQLGRHRVVAPFDGVVANRRVDPGDWVDPGVEVIELVRDLRPDCPIILFTAATGTELWRTDGTPAGTVLVHELPGALSSDPEDFVVVAADLLGPEGRAVHVVAPGLVGGAFADDRLAA